MYSTSEFIFLQEQGNAMLSFLRLDFILRHETNLPPFIFLILEKLTSEIQSRENKCMAMYKKLSKWPECNALSRRLLLKK